MTRAIPRACGLGPSASATATRWRLGALALAALTSVGCSANSHLALDAGTDAPVLSDTLDPGHVDAPACPSPLELCRDRCVDTGVDPAHCGGCDVRCEDAAYCQDGACRSACPAPFRACGAECVDLGTHPLHCGTCEVSCRPGETCAEGLCVAVCTAPRLVCGGECVDPFLDRRFCGAVLDCAGPNAGEACASGHLCELGRCVLTCSEGLLACGTTCIDPSSDRAHCGAVDCESGSVCSAGETCEGGACTPSCGPPLVACGGACVDPTRDADADLVPDGCDACPGDPGNDADADGLCAASDPCPADPANDDDGDGVCGDVDRCAGYDDQVDTDGDGIPDGCDPVLLAVAPIRFSSFGREGWIPELPTVQFGIQCWGASAGGEVGHSLFVYDGVTGDFDVDRAAEPTYDGFVGCLTNGDDDTYGDWTAIDGFVGTRSAGRESNTFDPLLSGARVAVVRLHLDEMRVNYRWGSIYVYPTGRWEIWGYPP